VIARTPNSGWQQGLHAADNRRRRKADYELGGSSHRTDLLDGAQPICLFKYALLSRAIIQTGIARRRGAFNDAKAQGSTAARRLNDNNDTTRIIRLILDTLDKQDCLSGH